MLLKDPVCKMEIYPRNGAETSGYQRQTYYLCSADCKRAFNKVPAGFLGSMKGEIRGKSA